ncbi:FadR/GntR family transcriptional regulator [Acinetobacter rudis]|uniref:FadR/GntR family transcriptional regulator n=1 Tax=Acinetobacter rudis TaxID=632955 RepID=A0AAW8JA91_9GAMM|nr:FadR/GntR family transcriptional regulator [Acinetobacter rudis]MDQ8936071.1 FadR/GntR family transcriptional regulator [Acinetobacter rudis]MDQ8953248.1 FadR/GntR family transcriptional regulator [Acinetobacter rudis]MDQ9018334.1 FadR/GntR family transcriptional regulator [Acinetobacter rudis]
MQQTRLYQTIVSKIQDDIKNGLYTVGSKLPPERDLAQQLGVSRTSIREAIIALEVCGIVEVKLGSGVYVLKTQSDSVKNTHNDVLNIHPQLAPFLTDSQPMSPFELLEARLYIEPYLAELAAKFRTEQQLAEIKQAFLINVSDNLEHSHDHIGDRLFHIRIAEASQNNAFAFFLKYLLGQQYTEIFSRLLSLYTPTDMALRSQYEHQEILTAIQNQEPERARKAMHSHIDHVIQIFANQE